MEDTNHASRDILANRLLSVFMFWLPIAAIVAMAHTPVLVRTPVWAGACTVMGVSCLVNAVRCGRIHCHFSGPFFLIMAGIIVACGTGVWSFGPKTWNYLGLALLVGGIAVTYVPELVFGKYRAQAR